MKRLQFALEDETAVAPVDAPAAVEPAPADPAPVESAPAPADADPLADAPEEFDVGIDEGEADAVEAEVQEQADNNEATSAVMESISMYASNLEYLIATKTCSLETLDLVNFGVQQQLNRIGFILPTVSLESDSTVEQKHIQALEGLREVGKRMEQAFVVQHKKVFDELTGFFKTSAGSSATFGARLTKGKAEFEAKKGTWKDSEHEGSLVEAWQFFRTKKTGDEHTMADLPKDVEMSRYVLAEYPKVVLDLTKKFVAILKGGNANDLKSAGALAVRVQGLSHPADAFKKSFLTTDKSPQYFDVTGLEMTQGTLRNPIAIGDKALTKLAQLATAAAVKQTKSFKHGFSKVVSTNHSNVMAPRGLKLSTNEIGALFDEGQEYIKNVNAYLALDKEMDSTLGELDDAIWALFEPVIENKEMSKDETRQIRQILGQFNQVADNMLHCFMSPATKELSRSLTGARYCNYLGLRMISNAK